MEEKIKSFEEIINDSEMIDESCDAFMETRRVIRRMNNLDKKINDKLDAIYNLILNKPKHPGDPYGEENWDEK